MNQRILLKSESDIKFIMYILTSKIDTNSSNWNWFFWLSQREFNHESIIRDVFTLFHFVLSTSMIRDIDTFMSIMKQSSKPTDSQYLQVTLIRVCINFVQSNNNTNS